MGDLEQRESREKLEHAQLIRDLQSLLDTDFGKRWFRWFFREFPFVREVYSANANTYFLAGQVAVSRQVYEMLSEACADLMIPLLLREDVPYGEVARS